MPKKPSTSRRPPPRRSRAEKKDETKAQILRAALKLFSQKGFARTTTKEISHRAGIAEGTLFNYFKTKEDLALYFYELGLSDLLDWYRATASLKTASLPEKLFAIIHRHLEAITPYEDFVGAVYLRSMQPTSRLSPLSLDTQAVNLRYLRFIRGLLEDAEEKREIPPSGDFGAYAFGLFHLAIVTYWLRDHSKGKENTLALLDRSLKFAHAAAKQGAWDW